MHSEICMIATIVRFWRICYAAPIEKMHSTLPRTCFWLRGAGCVRFPRVTGHFPGYTEWPGASSPTIDEARLASLG